MYRVFPANGPPSVTPVCAVPSSAAGIVVGEVGVVGDVGVVELPPEDEEFEQPRELNPNAIEIKMYKIRATRNFSFSLSPVKKLLPGA
jgi:hypothetical protein